MCTLDSSFFLLPPNLCSSNWKVSQWFCDFYMCICLLLGRISTNPPSKNDLSSSLTYCSIVCLFVLGGVCFLSFSFRKWLCKSNLKFSRQACNRMRSESVITGTIEPGYYQAIQNLSPSVFAACPSISLVFSGLPSSLFSAYIFLPPSVPR